MVVCWLQVIKHFAKQVVKYLLQIYWTSSGFIKQTVHLKAWICSVKTLILCTATLQIEAARTIETHQPLNQGFDLAFKDTVWDTCVLSLLCVWNRHWYKVKGCYSWIVLWKSIGGALMCNDLIKVKTRHWGQTSTKMLAVCNWATLPPLSASGQH
jgi:hypothetical protein